MYENHRRKLVNQLATSIDKKKIHNKGYECIHKIFIQKRKGLPWCPIKVYTLGHITQNSRDIVKKKKYE